MRILAITHLFPNEGNPNDGIFAARQLHEMKRQGADITVLVPLVWCPAPLRRFRRWTIYNHHWRCRYKGLEATTTAYIRLPGKWYRTFAHHTLYYGIRKRVICLHNARPFDVIYARFLHPEGYAAVRLAGDLNVPAVGVGAGDEVNVYPNESRLFKRRLLNIVKSLDGVMASGYAVAGKIDAMNDKKTLTVHGVVDLNRFAPVPNRRQLRQTLNLPPDKFIVLFAGAYKRAKGLYELIDVMGRLSEKHSNVILKICGYGREENEMLSTIRTKGLEHVIEMIGLVDPGQMHKWMQAADMFVLPSYAEGMPNAVMEAAACGLPVVASAVGGIPEEFGDCDAAILIEPRNADALEEAMLRVVRNENLRAKMGIAARKLAENRFGVERNARMVLDYLCQIVEQKRTVENSRHGEKSTYSH